MHPRFTGVNLEKNKIIYERINVLASKHACTPSQLALAWLLHQGNDIIPIPGTVLIIYRNNTCVYVMIFLAFLLNASHILAFIFFILLKMS
jgi:hypothetical protein